MSETYFAITILLHILYFDFVHDVFRINEMKDDILAIMLMSDGYMHIVTALFSFNSKQS